MIKCLKHDDDEGHDWFHKAELERCLLTEPQEADSVSLPHQAASSINAIGPEIKQQIKIMLSGCNFSGNLESFVITYDRLSIVKNEC